MIISKKEVIKQVNYEHKIKHDGTTSTNTNKNRNEANENR